MTDIWLPLGILAIWLAFQLYILPKMGVNT